MPENIGVSSFELGSPATDFYFFTRSVHVTGQDINGYGMVINGNVNASSYLSCAGGVQPGSNALNTPGGTLWNGTGVPNAALGVNGDFYFRIDTPGTANQRIYVKSAGAWIGIV